MSQLNVNTINERTSASGVTIDGVLIKDNKLASGTGNVLQVVSGTDASAVNITSTSMTDTGLSASITPSATSSKILVLINHNAFVWGPGAVPFAYFQVLRDSTNISGGGSYGIAFGKKAYLHGDGTVSYTHLTLPTILLV